MSEKILVVDDEPRLVRLVREVLRAAGYQVLSATNGQSSISMVALEQPDLVLLDIVMHPGPDGYEVCQHIRTFSEVPIIMLTAMARETDMLRGFDVGVDDYLTKPFSAKELVARVKAVLHRSRRPKGAGNTQLTYGELEVNLALCTVKMRGKQVRLTRTEFGLLRYLIQNVNRVVPHRELLSEIWGPAYVDDVDYLRAYVRYLRRKLEVDPSNPQYILTSPGLGYLLTYPGQEDISAP